jgi:hypothetical protein
MLIVADYVMKRIEEIRKLAARLARRDGLPPLRLLSQHPDLGRDEDHEQIRFPPTQRHPVWQAAPAAIPASFSSSPAERQSLHSRMTVEAGFSLRRDKSSLRAECARPKWLTATDVYTTPRSAMMRLMDLELERRLQEIRYENRVFVVRMISAVATVVGVALAFGVVVGWCARGGPLIGI